MQPPSIWPGSVRGINNLETEQKLGIYRTLIPDWLLRRFQINPNTFSVNGKSVIELRSPPNSRAMELSLFHEPGAADPVMYVNMADSLMNQLMVLLVMVNDPNSPRYNVDRLPDGRSTNLGTSARNLAEEERALNDGLAPGQIRQGLRGFRDSVPYFERFVDNMHHDLFLIEPLSYHNAVVFERYGFGYTVGRKEMESIHHEFQPDGDLHRMLDASTPFRQPDAWRSIRGRSWAIHDGILGHAFTGFHMYKRLYHNAGVNTFPDAVW
jgi:hypothetical protein